MNKWQKWELWKKIRDWSNRRMKDAWMEGGNCDSACPNCKQWESLGNRIETVPLESGLELRKCKSCGNEWQAIFTPAGFVPVDPCLDVSEKT